MPKSLMKSVYGGQDIFDKDEVEQMDAGQQPPVEDIATDDMAGLDGTDPLALGGV